MGAKNRWRSGAPDEPRITELKIDLCRKIYWIMAYEQKPTGYYAVCLGTSKATISRIRREKVNELSLDQLFFFLARLKPFFRYLIAIN